MTNIVSGFLITDRMLKMFREREREAVIHGLTQLTYLAAAALFILSLRWLSHPKTARRGVAAGVGGMALADRRHAARTRDRQLLVDRDRGAASGSSSACRCRGCRSLRFRSGRRCRTPSAASPPDSSARPST